MLESTSDLLDQNVRYGTLKSGGEILAARRAIDRAWSPTVLPAPLIPDCGLDAREREVEGARREEGSGELDRFGVTAACFVFNGWASRIAES